ncbi:MAG: ornithine carbamoyltransferase, partial [Chloroflexota bacterium]|nr:ornithine carbamoyltransferase [Chloroflexota bacterium]
MKHFTWAPRAGGAHILSIADLDPPTTEQVLADALELKVAGGRAAMGRLPLAGRSVALLLEQPSLRTRVSFEVGVARLG